MIDAIARKRGRVSAYFVAVCLLCTLPYWRALTLPLISDDYLQLWLGRQYGPFDQWAHLASDPLYRCRATSIWLTAITDALFGPSPLVFNFQSMLLHALNTGLVIALGRWKSIGYALSVPMALIWGFMERHHEAVMWYAALPEQLVFCFTLLAFLFWIEFWQSGRSRFYGLSILAFVLALLSKESAVVLCPLLCLPLLFDLSRWRFCLIKAAPMWLLAAAYFVLNYVESSTNLHWNDGTFHLGWHFLPVILNSTGRLLLPWGFAALVVICLYRKSIPLPLPLTALLWILISLGPYAFVTYQPRVPSRHVYLASAGVALLLALALKSIAHRRMLSNALIAAFILFNTSYIWLYKHDQFVERAKVTESLVESAAHLIADQPNPRLQVSCFPLAPEIAVIAISHHLGLSESNVVVNKTRADHCGQPQVDLIEP